MENTHIKTSTWSLPPAALELQSQQVDIWRVCLDLPADFLMRLHATLSTEESQRAARFHFPADRDRFIAAHGCLRDILTRYLPLDSGHLSFSNNAYGKPRLSTGLLRVSSEHGLDFNLSHSRDFALVAVTVNRRVGVDIEQFREKISREEIARRFFSKREVSELLTLPPEQREAAFFNCWTRKEAYIKAHGLGLSLPLDSFDVSLTPGEPAILRATRPDPQEAACWTLQPLEVQPGYAAAVAVEGRDLEFRLWDWTSNVTLNVVSGE